MKQLQSMTSALDYIEQHLTEHTDYEAIAKAAYCSNFHFQRLFYAVSGYTIGDYIRCRRLALAAEELAAGRAKVIDVALKYGYDSPESFSRAFRRFHGISPSQAKAGEMIKTFSKLSVKITITGGRKMDYRIEKENAIDIIVKKKRFNKDKSMTINEIPAFWRESMKDGTIERIVKYVHQNNLFKNAIIGIGLEYLPNEDDFPYGIGCHYNGAEVTDIDLEIVTIPEATYIKFPVKGNTTEVFAKTYKFVFEEFFPNSDYYPCGVEIEVYPDGDASKADYQWELWFAIEKKRTKING